MKQVLLRVTAMLAKIVLRKFTQLARGRLPFSRKIFLAQNALDPDIDRKRAQAFVGKQHDAVRHLCADAGQLAKTRAQFIIRQRADQSSRFASPDCDQSRRRPQIFCAIPECARAQFVFDSFAPAVPRSEKCERAIPSIIFRSPKRVRNAREICRICATCFIDEQMNVARHSQFGWRMMRRPRQKSRASSITRSRGKEWQIFSSG